MPTSGLPTSHRLLACLVALIWGVNFLAIHASLDQFPPLFLVALRFTLLAVPTLLLVPRPQVPTRWLVGYGLGFGVLQFTFLYTGMAAGMPAGLASLVLQASGPFTLILGAADAYKEAGTMMPSSTSCTFHARFLRALVEREVARARRVQEAAHHAHATSNGGNNGSGNAGSGHGGINIDPSLQGLGMGSMNIVPPLSVMPPTAHGHGGYALPTPPGGPESISGLSSGPTSPHGPHAHPSPASSVHTGMPDAYSGYYSSGYGTSGSGGSSMMTGSPEGSTHGQIYPAAPQDHMYYHNMCRELGVTEGGDLMGNYMMYRGVS